MLKKNTCSCLCYYGILLAEDEKIKTREVLNGRQNLYCN